jgi:hypothetical protein
VAYGLAPERERVRRAAVGSSPESVLVRSMLTAEHDWQTRRTMPAPISCALPKAWMPLRQFAFRLREGASSRMWLTTPG